MATIVSSSLMRHPLEFKNVVKTEEEECSHSELFVSFATTRGYFKKRSGFPILEDNTVAKLADEYDCWCYWRNAIEANLQIDTHIVYDGKKFRIITWNRVSEDRRYMYFKLISANEY